MHVLVVPRAHIPTLNDLLGEHDALVGSMVRLASTIAAERGYSPGGYRTVFNCNRGCGSDGVPPAPARPGRPPNDLAAGVDAQLAIARN